MISNLVPNETIIKQFQKKKKKTSIVICIKFIRFSHKFSLHPDVVFIQPLLLEKNKEIIGFDFFFFLVDKMIRFDG